MWKFKYYNSETNTVNWDELDKLDWISDMKTVKQNPIFHGEIYVYVHTKMVVDNLLKMTDFQVLDEQDKHILVTSALLHDVEKRSTTILENGVLRTPNHAKKGMKTANVILYKYFNTPLIIREEICNMIKLHSLPLNILDKLDPNREVIESSLLVNNFKLFVLSKADVLGRICSDADEQLEKINFFLEYCIDNNCLHEPKQFKSNLARFKYLSDKSSFVDYIPFDDTKFKVILMSGIPGSGKDYYIKNNLKDWNVISLDNIRREHKISPTDKSGNGTVIQLAKEQAKVYMRKHENFIWNATNITKQMRQQLIDLFLSYGAHITIIYIEKSYEELIYQNNNREYVVPNNVIDNLINKLEIPAFSEAHEIIKIK